MGNIPVHHDLGNYFYTKEKNYWEAEEWFRKGTEVGDAGCAAAYGFCHESMRSLATAINFYKIALEAGNNSKNENLIQLLLKTGRSAEAREIVTKFPEKFCSFVWKYIEQLDFSIDDFRIICVFLDVEKLQETMNFLEIYRIFQEKTPIHIRNSPEVSLFISSKCLSDKFGMKEDCIVCLRTNVQVFSFPCFCTCCETCYFSMNGTCRICRKNNNTYF